jgi:hypothetical protein
MGPAIVLGLLLLLLVAAGVLYVAIAWQDTPEAREGRVFHESRDMDAVIQQAPAHAGGAPDWIRLNLRDGKALVARAEHAPDAERLRIRISAVTTDPASEADPGPPDWVVARHRTGGGGLAEAIAIHDGSGNRVGSVVPTDAPRPFAAPPIYEARFFTRRYRIEGLRLLAPPTGEAEAADPGPDDAGASRTGPPDPDADLIGRLFPGPFPRIAWVQWRGAAAGPGPVHDDATLVALLAWWNTALYRSRMLRIPLPGEEAPE